MKSRAGLFLACAAAVVGAIAITPRALAESADDVAAWANMSWYRGYLEAGGRVFLNDPQRNGITSQGGQSLAKFYEYSTLKPGPFLDIYLATGTNDGLYRADFWGTNVGYSDQNYWLNLSKAGKYYVTLGWDQTPHVYSTSALTLYNGLGTNALTLPPGLSNALFTAAGCARAVGLPPTAVGAGCGTMTAANAAAVRTLIDANVHRTDLGIRRDTASVESRYTPTDAWDIRVNYSNMYRTGTQIEGVVFSPGTSGVTSQVPKPVSDTTQNYGASGEYSGLSSWGQKFTAKLAYSGSTFQNDLESYTVQNPFCPTGAGPGECARTASPSSPLALMSSWPGNQANGFTGTLAADLPGKSRYMGTITYTMMRQNDAFPPFTISPTVYTNAANTTQGAAPGLPAASLNGSVNTLLFNNVLTTQLTPELKTKLSYRLYDIQNNTPELFFPNWVVTDVKLASVTTAAYAPVRSLSIAYTKQNAGAEANWRPSSELNLGAAYGHERYDWTRADADVTNENSGKVYADWKPMSGVTARASVLFSQRRYDNYNYAAFVQAMQWPNTVPGTSTAYSPAYRQLFLDNRDRNQGKLSLAVDLSPSFTITPTFGWRYDDYNLNPNAEVGLNLDHSWNSGVEVMYIAAPGTNFLFSYIYESHQQLLTSCGQNIPSAAACTAAVYYSANVQDRVNTFIVAVNHEWIPNKFDVRIGYTLSYARNSQPLTFANGTGPTAASGGQYPDVRTMFQRLEAIAKYRLDDDLVRRLGWKGNVTAKLRYAWERTSVSNWQDDMMQTYMFSPAFTAVGYMDWLAFNNPNYNVHLLMASLAFTW